MEDRIKMVLHHKEVNGFTWEQLSNGIRISPNGLRIAFGRGKVKSLFLDQVEENIFKLTGNAIEQNEQINLIPNSEKIRDLRALSDLSQIKFAELIGVSPKTIVNWESGTTEPGTAKLKAIEKKVDSFIENSYNVAKSSIDVINKSDGKDKESELNVVRLQARLEESRQAMKSVSDSFEKALTSTIKAQATVFIQSMELSNSHLLSLQDKEDQPRKIVTGKG